MPMFDSSPACMPGLCFWLPGPIRWPVGPGCWRGLSVLARVVSRRAYGSWTTLGLPRTSRYIVRNSVAFPLGALGLRHRLRFSKLISSPADASIYASPGPSRCPAQDSRSRWFRYSFLVGLFHPRLHAGLSRRLRRGRDGCYQPPPAQTRTCRNYCIRFLPWIDALCLASNRASG